MDEKNKKIILPILIVGFIIWFLFFRKNKTENVVIQDESEGDKKSIEELVAELLSEQQVTNVTNVYETHNTNSYSDSKAETVVHNDTVNNSETFVDNNTVVNTTSGISYPDPVTPVVVTPDPVFPNNVKIAIQSITSANGMVGVILSSGTGVKSKKITVKDQNGVSLSSNGFGYLLKNDTTSVLVTVVSTFDDNTVGTSSKRYIIPENERLLAAIDEDLSSVDLSSVNPENTRGNSRSSTPNGVTDRRSSTPNGVTISESSVGDDDLSSNDTSNTRRSVTGSGVTVTLPSNSDKNRTSVADISSM